MAHCQLRHGAGGGLGGILHGEAAALRVGYVDVVHDQLQPAALSGIQLGSAELGGAADHHRVKVPQCLA